MLQIDVHSLKRNHKTGLQENSFFMDKPGPVALEIGQALIIFQTSPDFFQTSPCLFVSYLKWLAPY